MLDIRAQQRTCCRCTSIMMSKEWQNELKTKEEENHPNTWLSFVFSWKETQTGGQKGPVAVMWSLEALSEQPETRNPSVVKVAGVTTHMDVQQPRR